MCIPVCLFNLRAMSKELKFMFGESSQYEQQDRVKFKSEPNEPPAKNSTTRVGVREPSERVMRLMAEILEKDERCKTSAVRKQSGADGVAKFVREAVAVKSIQRKERALAGEEEFDRLYASLGMDDDKKPDGQLTGRGEETVEDMKKENARLRAVIAKLEEEKSDMIDRDEAFKGNLNEKAKFVKRALNNLGEIVETGADKSKVQERIEAVSALFEAFQKMIVAPRDDF